MRNKSITALGALALALATVVVPTAPTATAAPAPWTWVRVTHDVAVAPQGYYSIRVFCPAGYTALTGGLELPTLSRLQRNAEYRYDDGSGSSWFVAFENFSNSSGSARVVAECARTADLPAISHNYAEFAAGDNQVWSGSVACLNPGEVVLTGGVDWSNVNTRRIWASGPLWSGEGWRAFGRNDVANAKMGVEAYCVDPAQVPGYTRVEINQSGSPNWERTATCPLGTRVLNGGTEEGYANASYPTINRWTATGQYDVRTFVRVWCIDAGRPTVAMSPTPGPSGSITTSRYASFNLGGIDPAGFPAAFRCSIDNGQIAPCGANETFGPFANGSHQVGVFHQTPDGRTSNLLTYQWTVDRDPPVVTTPGLAKVSLVRHKVTWKASDVDTGVATHQAKLWRATADGSVVDWSFPTGWDDLASPSVTLPPLTVGETLCISVRAIDAAGGAAPWTPPRCTSRPIDDRGLATLTPGWTRLNSTDYWNGTATRTTTTGQKLRRLNVTFAQVGVLATVCAGCGSVDLAVDGVRIGRINLDRTSTVHQKAIVLPAAAVRTGTVTITSVTSGRNIRVDGLITIRGTADPPPPD